MKAEKEGVEKPSGPAKSICDICPPSHIIEGLESARLGFQGTSTVGRGCACEACVEKFLSPLISENKLLKAKAALAEELRYSFTSDDPHNANLLRLFREAYDALSQPTKESK